jgi:NAD-dependent dihydropyrimidine dehydrogenase PreA subunit/flavodoxin
MILKKKIFLYFFSGTGNTLWVSKIFAEEMRKYGTETKILPLPCPPPGIIDDDTILAVAFPVYAQTAPPFVCDWLRSLPETKKETPVIMLSTFAGSSGLVKGPFHHLLSKKGYTPLAVREFIMPPNYFHKYGEDRNSQIRERAKLAIADFAREVSGGKTKWTSRPAFLNILQLVAQKIFRHGGSGWFGKGFRADKAKCTKCGLCMKLCPVDNINLAGDGYPGWGGRCQQCLRCITYCPTSAISNFRMRLVAYPGYKCAEIKAADLIREAQPQTFTDF